MRFLIINPFGIGDVLFSTPLIRNIKDNFPSSKIFYLSNQRTSTFLKEHPLIDKVFVYERDEFEKLKQSSQIKWVKAFFSFLERIKKEKIDISYDLSLSSHFAFFSWYLRIKKRVGFNFKGRGHFLNYKLDIEGFEDKHVVEYYLQLLELLNIQPKKYPLEVYTNRDSHLWADDFLKRNNLKDDLCIGLAPCGGEAFGPWAEIKRWPKDKFQILIEELVKRYSAKIFLFAGPKEKQEITHILDGLKKYKDICYSFCDVSILQLIALIDKVELMIANDTGPLRIADALQKKVIALFGPVDEKVYSPYPYDKRRTIVLKRDLECRPCYRQFRLSKCVYNKRCLREIDVGDVIEAVDSLGVGKSSSTN